VAGQRIVIADTGPLLALSWIHRVGLLNHLFDRVVVPFEVWGELAHRPDAFEPPQVAALSYLEFAPPDFLVPAEAEALDPGERAVLALAVGHLPRATLLIDERRARKAAKELGLRVVGTLGVLVEAKRQGLLTAIGPLMEEMISNGIYFGPQLVERILAAVGDDSRGSR